MPEEPKINPGNLGSAIATKETGPVKKKFNPLAALNSFFLSVPLQERVLFSRHLGVGIRSGMTLQDSLKLIHDQTRSKTFKKILDVIITDTANGMFLSTSMDKYSHVFGSLFINVVRVGESSGTLTENLAYLAVELKKKQALRSKIRGALIYPAVIFFATIGIVITLMVGVFPKILPVFASLKVKLPVTTKILIATSKFFTANFLWIILGIVLTVILIIVLSRYEFIKHGWHHLMLRIPIIGKMAVKVNAATLARTLGLLLNSGVKIIEAVNITADTLDNRVYRHELRSAGETLRRGDFFSIYLAKKPRLFPAILTNMIQVGENTGNLTENLKYLSEFYEEDIEEVLKNLSSIMEPALLLFMGLLVGFMALSVITPIYQISQTLTL